VAAVFDHDVNARPDDLRRYLSSSTFWVLMIGGPILWALSIVLLARLLMPWLR
jgi:hypothetical protein